MGSSPAAAAKVFTDFTIKSADETTDVPMDELRGKVIVAVNVASKCGLAENNYRQLSDLLDKYHEQGLRMVLFPCNQFGSQEPGEACQIRQFGVNWNKNFIMTEKVLVNGSDAHPLWKWMKETGPSGFLINAIKWNYTKFIIGKDGKPIARYGPNDDPNKMTEDIEKALKA